MGEGGVVNGVFFRRKLSDVGRDFGANGSEQGGGGVDVSKCPKEYYVGILVIVSHEEDETGPRGEGEKSALTV